MTLPDVRTLSLAEDVLPDSTPEAGRIVLWVRGPRDGRGVDWERISSHSRSEIRKVGDVCSIEARVLNARQHHWGLLAKLIHRSTRDSRSHELMLPTGETAKRVGDRRADALLAWSTDHSAPLDASRIQSLWPTCRGFRLLAENLVLVNGAEAIETPAPTRTSTPDLPLRERAERMLSSARRTNDARAQVFALTDLGILLTEQGDARNAIRALEEALALARSLGNRSWEADVLSNLGLPVLADQQPQRALELFLEAAATARAAGNILAEKVTLERLGLAYAAMEDHAQALAYFDQALTLARRVGDRPHQATLCWNLAIQLAELGERDRAIAEAQQAVDILEQIGKPEAVAYRDHLASFRQEHPGAGLGSLQPTAILMGGAIHTSAVAVQESPAMVVSESGPGLLRMAVTAAKSLAKLVCTRFKTVAPEIHRERVRICSTCDDHTGLRCLVCGCFTDAKARMPHEDCPRGKWPAYVPSPLADAPAVARGASNGRSYQQTDWAL